MRLMVSAGVTMYMCAVHAMGRRVARAGTHLEVHVQIPREELQVPKE